jgi:rare lipoprotein A
VSIVRTVSRFSPAVMIAVFCAGCATAPRPSPPPPVTGPTLTGVASWYGPGFNGHRTSSGEIYDQNALTAASTLFPLGTRLRVTNLNNGRSVDVAINDHGPFMKGRSLDVSRQAARRLGLIGVGTAPVRMEVLRTPPGGAAIGQRYFIQLGSFANPLNADHVRDSLAGSYPEARVTESAVDGDARYRVRLGAYSDRKQAESRAARLIRLGYHPEIVTE